MDDKTGVFDVNLVKKQLISETLKEIYDALEERGYNPLNQLVGYLISGDPGYISNFKGSRNKILNYDRAEVMAIILDEYLNK
ncbi:MAG: IreB family regulatory phosphoprotein [Bacilli bacterium]|nr:IreB family regulatory phosphoprotein [Bacilli bacterium]